MTANVRIWQEKQGVAFRRAEAMTLSDPLPTPPPGGCHHPQVRPRDRHPSPEARRHLDRRSVGHCPRQQTPCAQPQSCVRRIADAGFRLETFNILPTYLRNCRKYDWFTGCSGNRRKVLSPGTRSTCPSFSPKSTPGLRMRLNKSSSSAWAQVGASPSKYRKLPEITGKMKIIPTQPSFRAGRSPRPDRGTAARTIPTLPAIGNRGPCAIDGQSKLPGPE